VRTGPCGIARCRDRAEVGGEIGPGNKDAGDITWKVYSHRREAYNVGWNGSVSLGLISVTMCMVIRTGQSQLVTSTM
jgi:hypothetical protein